MWVWLAAAARRRVTRRAMAWLVAAVPTAVVGILVLSLMALLSSQPGSLGSQTLVSNTCVGVVPSGSAPPPAGLSPDQVLNAQTIVAVGRQKQVPPYGWVIAIATTLQESTLHNLPYGDRDGAYEDDLRVVSDPRMTTNGDFVVSVLAEHDWYRWPAVEYGATHRSLRALRICRIWVEV